MKVQTKYALRIKELANTDILAVVIDGKLTADDYKVFNRAADARLKITNKLCCLIEIIDLDGVSLGAMWEDVKAGFKYYDKMQKIAVVGHQDAVENAAEAAEHLTPGLELKYFDISDKDAALTWLK